MSGTPTSKQALILWCLLGRHGSALQSTLVPRIDRADREALIAARYLEAEKQGRSLLLTVTDRGWAWAGAHMGEPLPPNFRVLQDWLERLQLLAAARKALAAAAKVLRTRKSTKLGATLRPNEDTAVFGTCWRTDSVRTRIEKMSVEVLATNCGSWTRNVSSNPLTANPTCQRHTDPVCSVFVPQSFNLRFHTSVQRFGDPFVTSTSQLAHNLEARALSSNRMTRPSPCGRIAPQLAQTVRSSHAFA